MNNVIKRLGKSALMCSAWLGSPFDRTFLVDDIPMDHVRPEPWELPRYIDSNSGQRLRVLEIGSREVTGPSKAREKFAGCEYVGFDYYQGRNVDVVGDAHHLSSYFEANEKFDIIYSIACFEHFAMPWLVALEIAKILKVGGIVYVKTHFSNGAHERPWNFFQFSDMGLRVLFPTEFGFECIVAGMSNPLVGHFSAMSDRQFRYRPIRGLFFGSEYIGRKVREEQFFDWRSVAVDGVVAGTTYPEPKK